MFYAVLLSLFYIPISVAFNVFVILTSPLWAFIAAFFKLEVLPGVFSWVHTHDENIYGGPVPPTFTQRFRQAVWWLCRNPGYGFDAYVLGYADSDVLGQIYTTNDEKFGGEQLAWTLYLMELRGRHQRFCLVADIPLFAGRYLKFWLGWHMMNQAGRRMFKFDFNPFKRVGS